MKRPTPPPELGKPGAYFMPAPELEEWARALFIDPEGAFHNPDHEHLARAELGFVWTSVEKIKEGRLWAGSAQVITESGDKWSQGARLQQLDAWFGGRVDFLVHVFGPWAGTVDDATFCALIDHELYHCSVKRKDGEIQFQPDGMTPVWSMRGHDVEQFTGVVLRWGAKAAGVEQMVAVAQMQPLLGHATASAVCGSCR